MWPQPQEGICSSASACVRPAFPLSALSLAQIIRGTPLNKLINVFKTAEIKGNARKITPVTVDSGACDSIVPPPMFPNTPIKKHNEVGRTYGACGGETVTNVGVKDVRCLMSDGSSKSLKFQVGDKITRGLLAVSQLASSGAGVWFGPGPEYESFIA